MSTILWIILIDCSGSMSEHFSGLGEFDGFSEVGDYEIKIDAAKDVLIKQIKGLSFNCDVAVIKFSDDAELVCKDSSKKVQQFESQIRELKAGGNTNIEAALSFGLNLENLGSYRRVHFLLISDGLSNVGDPIPVAQKCYELDIDVNTILIDPTPEGEKIARQISIDGRVTSVTSSLQLASAVEKEREPVEQDARMAASNRVLTQITLITALFAFFATALGFVNGVLKQPVEMLIFLAVIAILGAGFLMWYVGFAKYLPKIYVPNPQKIPKYTKKTRVFSFVSSALLIILGMTFLYIAFLNLKSTASSYDNTKNLLTIYWNFKK